MLKRRVWYQELWLHENVGQNDIVIVICLCLQIIREQYYIQQSALLKSLKGRAVDVAGDGSFDSPGHNALFGMYSLMDITSKKILLLHVLKVKKLRINFCFVPIFGAPCTKKWSSFSSQFCWGIFRSSVFNSFGNLVFIFNKYGNLWFSFFNMWESWVLHIFVLQHRV